MANIQPKLHWNQRVALVRHNLHEARLTGDFTFFKTLQAQALIDGTDHVATLNMVLGDEADTVLAALDNLNAGIAYVHQDAFKAVYDSAKSTMYKTGSSMESRKSMLRVDASQQRDMADHAIDKTANSAIQLIEEQPIHCQDAVANAWITGATIISDAVCVCLKQIDEIEDCMDDFIRLEYSWSRIQTSVDAAISALRGIFNLMAGGNGNECLRRESNASTLTPEYVPPPRARAPSNASAAFSMIKRAFNNQLIPPPSPAKTARVGPSPLGDMMSPRGLRQSVSHACPTKMPHIQTAQQQHRLSTIPHTPVGIGPVGSTTNNPFKNTKGDYFGFGGFDNSSKSDSSSSKDEGKRNEEMQIESLDPLYSPTLREASEFDAPLTLASLSEAFGVSAPSEVAA